MTFVKDFGNNVTTIKQVCVLWLLRSCSHALHNFIEIIRPSFGMTVLIYRDKRAWLWRWPALTWIAAPAPSKVASINSGFSSDYTSYVLVMWKCFLFSSWPGFSFDIRSLRKENLCKQYFSQQINTSLFRLTSSIDYIMLCSFWGFPPFVAIIRRCAQSQSLSPFTVKREKSTSAIMRGAIALATMMAFCTGTRGFQTLKSCF